VQLRYHYFFTPLADHKSISAQIDFQPLSSDFGKRGVAGVDISYVSYFQQETKVTGFRVGKMAYISDIREYSKAVVEALKGVEVLVVSALRPELSRMHFGTEEAIAFSKEVGAKSTYLTHISHELEHDATSALLPPGVSLAYDGLEIGW
jgi:phosphoribosyl 1,2-cyclic phosphate phosphodiesterase